jgi:hypothetical protein
MSTWYSTFEKIDTPYERHINGGWFTGEPFKQNASYSSVYIPHSATERTPLMANIAQSHFESHHNIINHRPGNNAGEDMTHHLLSGITKEIRLSSARKML